MKKYFWLLISGFATIQPTCKAKRIAFMPTHFYVAAGGGLGTSGLALVNNSNMNGGSTFLSHLNSDNTAGDYLKPYLFEGRLSLGYLPFVYRINQDLSIVLGGEASFYYKFGSKSDLNGADGMIDKYDVVAGPAINLFYRYFRAGLSWDAFQYENIDWKFSNFSKTGDKLSKAFGAGFTLSFGYEFMKRMEAMIYLKTARLDNFGSKEIDKFKSDTYVGQSLGIAIKIHG